MFLLEVIGSRLQRQISSPLIRNILLYYSLLLFFFIAKVVLRPLYYKS